MFQMIPNLLNSMIWKGQYNLSKALGLQWATVGDVINQQRKLGTVMNVPKSGRPAKMAPRAQWRLIEEVRKESRTSKGQQALLASVKVKVHDSMMRKRLSKNGVHWRVPSWNPLTKKNTEAPHTFAKKHLDGSGDKANLLAEDTEEEVLGRQNPQ